jgi:hypothetical protein
MCEDTSGGDDAGFSELNCECESPHVTKARIAEIYMIGGNNVVKNFQKAADFYTEAAEMAMATGKGRIATKYYALCEEAMALMDNVDDQDYNDNDDDDDDDDRLDNFE